MFVIVTNIVPSAEYNSREVVLIICLYNNWLKHAFKKCKKAAKELGSRLTVIHGRVKDAEPEVEKHTAMVDALSEMTNIFVQLSAQYCFKRNPLESGGPIVFDSNWLQQENEMDKNK